MHMLVLTLVQVAGISATSLGPSYQIVAGLIPSGFHGSSTVR